MAITGRVPLLLLLGLVAVVLRPTVGTMWLWVLVVAAGRPGSTSLLAPSPRRGSPWSGCRSTGSGPGRSPPARWPSATTARRRTALLVRDAWQPTAGASGNRHRLRLAPGDRTPGDHLAAPRPAAASCTRSGVTRADRWARSASRRGRPPATCPAGSGRCRRSSPASTCPRGSPGSATSTAGRRCGCAGRAPSSTRCASTCAATTSARSTGGPPPATAPSSSAPGSPSATGGWCSCSTPRASRPAGSTTYRAWTPRWRRRCC